MSEGRDRGSEEDELIDNMIFQGYPLWQDVNYISDCAVNSPVND